MTKVLKNSLLSISILFLFTPFTLTGEAVNSEKVLTQSYTFKTAIIEHKRDSLRNLNDLKTIQVEKALKDYELQLRPTHNDVAKD